MKNFIKLFMTFKIAFCEKTGFKVVMNNFHWSFKKAIESHIW